MAKRNIRHLGDDVLRKKSRTVETIDDKIVQLLEDMAETMYAFDGVGLAAPQVGILKRIAVIDIGDGLIELINPEIVSFEGSEKDIEGCLSVPGRYGYVLRPEKVKVTALDRNGEKLEISSNDSFAVKFHNYLHLKCVLHKIIFVQSAMFKLPIHHHYIISKQAFQGSQPLKTSPNRTKIVFAKLDSFTNGILNTGKLTINSIRKMLSP